jgi:hypothetical protein
MRRITVPVTAVLFVAFAAGCSTAGTPTPAAPAPVAPPTTSVSATGADAEAEVRTAFKAYNDSLLARDFTTACASITDSAAAAMSAMLEKSGGTKGASCEQVFTVVYRNQEAAGLLDRASKTLTLNTVDVQGDTANLTFTVPGVPPGKGHAQRVDGRWRFDTTG